MKADDPLRFFKSVVNEIQEDEYYGDESFTISLDSFEITNTLHIC